MKKCIRKIIFSLKREQDIEELKKKGLQIGKNFNKQGQVIIDPDHCWLITIGDNVTLASRVYILAHDASIKRHLGVTKIGNVVIGNRVFIGAGSIVLPNVTIGDDVVIAAGSVVSKNISSNSVVAGNPAKEITTLEKYLNKHQNLMQERPVYDDQWTTRKNINKEMKLKMKNQLSEGIGYVN